MSEDAPHVGALGRAGGGDLYDERIKALARQAHGATKIASPDASATRDNPLCGDRVTVDLRIDDDTIVALGHRTRGCLLCQASASMLGLRAPGLRVERIAELRDALAALLARRECALDDWPELAVFAPVAAHRSRHTCVALAIDAALAAVGEYRRAP